MLTGRFIELSDSSGFIDKAPSLKTKHERWRSLFSFMKQKTERNGGWRRNKRNPTKRQFQDANHVAILWWMWKNHCHRVHQIKKELCRQASTASFLLKTLLLLLWFLQWNTSDLTWMTRRSDVINVSYWIWPSNNHKTSERQKVKCYTIPPHWQLQIPTMMFEK